MERCGRCCWHMRITGPDVGYVQGMSFLAGMLALHIPDPAVCFQCLANLLGGEHLYAFYSLKVGLLMG